MSAHSKRSVPRWPAHTEALDHYGRLVTAVPTACAELTAADLAILDAVDEQALVDDLVGLLQVPSVTGTDAESELQHRQAAALAALGFDVDAWRLDLGELAAHPDFPGTEAPRVEGYGVVGTLGPAGVPALVL
jgi:acetylornithine deacetylase